jgi:multidrug efflux pump subunit AcrB
MRIAELGVRQSLIVNLLSILIIVVGVGTLYQMNREAFPNVNFDMVTVSTRYTGAPPEDIEKLVTTPIEKELKEVDDIDEIISVSTENQSVIIIQIESEAKNKDRTINEIQRAVDRADNIPDDADDSLVEDMKTSDRPIVEISLAGDMDEVTLREHARALKDLYEDILGVSKVEKRGWRDREFSVELNHVKLTDQHISFEEVIQAIRNRNLNLPAGTLTTPTKEYLIRTMGEFETAEELKKVIIRANDQGNWIRIQDVANVYDTFEEEDLIDRTNGHRAINLLIVKKKSGDTLLITDEVKEITEKYRIANPTLGISYIDDMSFFVKRRLNILKTNGGVGLILVIAALLIFLSPPVAFMTALGIPIAMLITLMTMHYLGISINLISMFGLIMVLGLVVDDAIVIGENIYRRMEDGEDVETAVIQGTRQVLLPVTLTVLTSILVFMALFMMTEIIGKYVREIPLVAMITLAASLLEAVIILPCHIADFSKMRVSSLTKPMKKWGQIQATYFGQMVASYTQILKSFLKLRVVVIVFAVIVTPFFIYLSWKIFGIKFTLFPSRGIEQLFIRADAPLGTDLYQTEKKMRAVEKIIESLGENELLDYVTTIGMHRDDPSEPATNRGTHLAQVRVFLTSKGERDRTTSEITEQIRKKLNSVEGFDEVGIDPVRSGPPVGKPVDLTIRGDDFDTLEEIASHYKEALNQMEGVKDIKDDREAGKEELRLIVDTATAKRVGLTTRDIATTVRNAFEGGIATTIKTGDVEEEIDVLVRFPKEDRSTKETFQRLLISNSKGNLIPLREIAKLEKAEGVHFVKHLDGKRAIRVTAEVDEEIITSGQANRRLMKETTGLLDHYPGYTLKFGGEQKRTKESLASLFRALRVSVCLIFILLAAYFRSLILPLLVMIAIPFAFMGVIIAFQAHNEPLSFMAILGMIGLAGVAVNDSIVLVSFISQLRKEGRGARESIIEGCQKRLRPVLLTTITTVLGLFPVAYGWMTTSPDPFVAPAALAISWGLIFATGLTLVVIPCLYSFVDTFFERVLHRSPP